MIYKDSFLNKLQKQQIQDKYAKITLLDWGERPIRSLEGEITGGSLNIDGNSAIRTTINLSMVVKNLDLTKYTIALRSKVSIEIGLKNNIDSSYPEIIWFKQGVFIVTGFNTSIGVNQSNLSISGKDKMCLLNGEISGSLPASIDFGQVDTYENTYNQIPTSNYVSGKYYYKDQINDKDFYFLDYSAEPEKNRQYYEKVSSVTTTKLTIKEIIHNIVYIWGHEAKTRIIINDLELAGNELLEYRGETPMYLVKQANTNSNIFKNLILDSSYELDGEPLKEWEESDFYNLNALDNEYNNVRTFKIDDISYVVIKIEYGETIGYRATDLTFAGDLIASPGESVVSILDKIKNMLGNFEYFYDINGNFIFQAKHSYELVNFNKFLTDGNNEVYLDGSFYNNHIIYEFNDEEETTNISHTPNLTNLRNDYSIWGERTSTSGIKNQIHLRYALQKKPELYYTIGDGPRSGLILKTKADSEKELQESNIRLQAAYDYQATLKSEIDNINNKYNDDVKETESEINDLRFSNTGSIKRILDVIRIKHLAKWKNAKTGETGYVGIEKYEIFKDKRNKNTNWMETFAQKHDYIVEQSYAQLLRIVDLIYEDFVQGEIELRTIQSIFNNYHIQNAVDTLKEYNPKYFHNLTQFEAFVWNKLFKYEYDMFDYEAVLKKYDSNWDFTFFHAYETIMTKYNDYIKDHEKQLTEYLQNKKYIEAIKEILYIWQIKNYRLYIQSFAEISRSLKYNAESEKDSETGEEVYQDDDYSYLKTGLGYNFGKPYPSYNKFMTSTNIRKYFLDYWLILNKERFNDFKVISKLFRDISEKLDYLKSLNKTLNTNLHNAEFKYYKNMDDLITQIKKSQIPLIVDWRELIYQMSRDFYDYGENSKYNYLSMLIDKNLTMLYEDYSTGYEPFYTDLISNWRSLYYNPLLESLEYNIENATGYNIEKYDRNNFWLISVQKCPSSINFWFDLTDGQEGLNEYTISKVGDRLKTIKDNSVSAIYYKDTPNILYLNEDFQNINNENYNTNSFSYFQLNGELSNLYSISTQSKSAFDELQDLLYKFTYCTENITITSLPVYTLKPNYRIMVSSKTPGLTGEFIINKITVPLLYNGTMQINATKAIPYLGIN